VTVVDARGHRCPYPIVSLGRAAAAVPAGTRIILLSDDPVSLTDVPAWCRMRAAELVTTKQVDDHWEFAVITGPPAPG
jgi:tRNA 2-thiouridine synthesizing protein A